MKLRAGLLLLVVATLELRASAQTPPHVVEGRVVGFVAYPYGDYKKPGFGYGLTLETSEGIVLVQGRASSDAKFPLGAVSLLESAARRGLMARVISCSGAPLPPTPPGWPRTPRYAASIEVDGYVLKQPYAGNCF